MADDSLPHAEAELTCQRRLTDQQRREWALRIRRIRQQPEFLELASFTLHSLTITVRITTWSPMAPSSSTRLDALPHMPTA
jgi:hypothetical protein